MSFHCFLHHVINDCFSMMVALICNNIMCRYIYLRVSNSSKVPSTSLMYSALALSRDRSYTCLWVIIRLTLNNCISPYLKCFISFIDSLSFNTPAFFKIFSASKSFFLLYSSVNSITFPVGIALGIPFRNSSLIIFPPRDMISFVHFNYIISQYSEYISK